MTPMLAIGAATPALPHSSHETHRANRRTGAISISDLGTVDSATP